MDNAGYCVKCGSPYHVNDLFCGHCGYKLGSRKCPLCGGTINCEDLPVGMNVSEVKTFVPSRASMNVPVPLSGPLPTPQPQPQTPEPQPQTPEPQPQTPEPQPQTPEPQPQTPEPQPQTPEPQPQIAVPQPQTPASEKDAVPEIIIPVVDTDDDLIPKIDSLGDKSSSDDVAEDNVLSPKIQTSDEKEPIDGIVAAIDTLGRKPISLAKKKSPENSESAPLPVVTIPSESKVPEDQRESLIMKVRVKLNPNIIPDLPNVPAIPQAMGEPVLAPKLAETSPVLPYLKTMTLGQLIANANAGDSHAMFRVGLFYDYLDNEVEIDGKRPKLLAREWYERAVLAGNGQALFAVCNHRLTCVLIYEAGMPRAYMPGDEQVISVKRDAYEWFSRGLDLFKKRAPGTELLNYSKFKENADKARYLYAASLYLSDADVNEVLKLVCNHADTASQLLTLLIFEDKWEQWRNTPRTKEQDSMATDERVKRLKKIMDIIYDYEYEKYVKFFCESVIYAEGVRVIAKMLFYEVQSPEKGIAILKRLRGGVTSDYAKKLIDDELTQMSEL